MPVVSVLWGLGLLAAISLSLLWNGNMSYSLVRNGLEVATSNATADAAVNRAVVALFDPRPEQRWRPDGERHGFEFEGTSIKVSIQDELGKIDLNQAPPALLAGLFAAVGQSKETAYLLTCRVVLRRGGLHVQEALALTEHDLDPRRGSVLVRCGKGVRRRAIGTAALVV